MLLYAFLWVFISFVTGLLLHYIAKHTILYEAKVNNSSSMYATIFDYDRARRERAYVYFMMLTGASILWPLSLSILCLVPPAAFFDSFISGFVERTSGSRFTIRHGENLKDIFMTLGYSLAATFVIYLIFTNAGFIFFKIIGK